VYPLQRTASFCKIFHPGSPEVKESLGHTQVIQLILQHLHVKGFKETRKILEKESQVKLPPQKLHSSRLLTYLRTSMRDVERLYDTFVGEKEKDSRPFEECVTSMDLHEEGYEKGEDMNIWEESEGNIMFCDANTQATDPSLAQPPKSIKAGSFNRLVEKLTDDTLMFDTTYIPAFIMTYQSFSTPEKLLQKLWERFDVPETVAEGEKKNIQTRVCNVMKKWIETYPNDFDERTRARVQAFIEHGNQVGASSVVAIVDNAFKRMLCEPKTRVVRIGQPPKPILPLNFFTRLWNADRLLDLDEEEIARQLTVMDWENFIKIKPCEMMDCAWSKPKLRYRSPNVLEMIRSFNSVSGWVVTMILRPETVHERGRVLSKFLRIAEKLLALNNYNSVMSILSGFNSSAVSRLKYTFEELGVTQQKSLRDIGTLMSSDNNFHDFRVQLASLDEKTPKIPYLGVYLTDLTFCQENSDNINGLINFSKRSMLYHIISAVLKHQYCNYSIQPVQQILEVLHKLGPVDEQTSYALSLKREPRGVPRSSIP